MHALCAFLAVSAELSAQWVPSLALMDSLVPDTVLVLTDPMRPSIDKTRPPFLFVEIHIPVPENAGLGQEEDSEARRIIPIRFELCHGEEEAAHQQLRRIEHRLDKCCNASKGQEYACGGLDEDDILDGNYPTITLEQFARWLYVCGKSNCDVIEKRDFYILDIKLDEQTGFVPKFIAHRYCRHYIQYVVWPDGMEKLLED